MNNRLKLRLNDRSIALRENSPIVPIKYRVLILRYEASLSPFTLMPSLFISEDGYVIPSHTVIFFVAMFS